MPVNGTTGSQRALTPSTTRTDEEEPVVEQPNTTLINTQDESALPAWMPNRTRGRATPEAGAPLTSDTVMQAALDRFKGRFESILGQDALSMARGGHPWREGDTLSEQQQHDLMRATEDLLKDTPVNKLSLQLARRVQLTLNQHGLNRDMATTRLGDLGHIGGDIAKSFVDQLRRDSPGTFYSVGAGAAAALGYVAWDQGSETLRRLGLKPEVNVHLTDTVRVGAGVDFDRHFQNLEGTVSADIEFPGSRFEAPDFRLGADAQIGDNGSIETMTTTASFTTPKLSGAAQASMRGNRLESISGSVVYTPTSNFALSAGAMWYEPDRSLTLGAEAVWRLSRNVDVAASITKDNQGETRAGVGARISF